MFAKLLRMIVAGVFQGHSQNSKEVPQNLKEILNNGDVIATDDIQRKQHCKGKTNPEFHSNHRC